MAHTPYENGLGFIGPLKKTSVARGTPRESSYSPRKGPWKTQPAPAAAASCKDAGCRRTRRPTCCQTPLLT